MWQLVELREVCGDARGRGSQLRGGCENTAGVAGRLCGEVRDSAERVMERGDYQVRAARNNVT